MELEYFFFQKAKGSHQRIFNRDEIQLDAGLKLLVWKNVWRGKQTDPGERQRPDGNDSIATQ